MTNWRDIPCKTINWQTVCTNSTWRRLQWLCRARGAWHELTLGELATMGEREWRCGHKERFGPKSIQTIKDTIDAAAEGVDVTNYNQVYDAYVPKCERVASSDKRAEEK